MDSLTYTYYRDVLFSLKRAKLHGVYINAKPILFITVLDALTSGIIHGNEILLSDSLIKLYYNNFRLYLPKSKPTPIFKPFFYLVSDGFWFLKLHGGYSLSGNPQTPSLKWQKEAIQYAFFCDSLYQLIQIEAEREKLKNEIIAYYFYNDNK